MTIKTGSQSLVAFLSFLILVSLISLNILAFVTHLSDLDGIFSFGLVAGSRMIFVFLLFFFSAHFTKLMCTEHFLLASVAHRRQCVP